AGRGGILRDCTRPALAGGGKGLELQKEIFPNLAGVFFLNTPADPSNVVELEQLRGPAAELGVTLRVVEARGPAEIEQAFSMIRERVEGLSTASGAVNNNDQRRIVEMAAKNRLPAIYHLASS